MAIKNLNLIQHIITDDQIEKLKQGVAQYHRYSRIHFKVLDISEDAITIQVVQTKSPAENYLSAKELADKAKGLFGMFFPEHNIHARPSAYVPPTVDHVSPDWISKKLSEKGFTQTDIVNLTGIDKTNVSAWINGNRPMSQPVKAMFYFMLK